MEDHLPLIAIFVFFWVLTLEMVLYGISSPRTNYWFVIKKKKKKKKKNKLLVTLLCVKLLHNVSLVEVEMWATNPMLFTFLRLRLCKLLKSLRRTCGPSPSSNQLFIICVVNGIQITLVVLYICCMGPCYIRKEQFKILSL